MMAGYNRNTSSSEEEEETKPNLRDIFRKPAASNNQAPSTKKSSKTREYSEGERVDDEYGTRKKTSSTTRVTGKIRNKGEPEKKSADDFMAIFQQTTLGERPEKAGLKNNLSSQRSSSDDSEEDEENKTPKSSVSSGSRSYPSKDKTEPSPDDPFKRLQAGMKDNSEEDDKKQTVTRHTSKSSVSSGSRSNLSKDKTVPSPDDPFTTLQAEIKADDSEEDDKNQTVSRHTPKSRVSSGSRKYQSKNKTVTSPDDPFTRLQAGMKADDSEKDDENQTVTRNTPTSSVSSGSRKYQSKDNTVPSPDDPFTRLQAGMKGNAQDKEKDELADDSEEDDENQTVSRHTPKSSVSSGSRKYQSKDNTVPPPDDPFTRLQAGMKGNAQDQEKDELADDSEEDDENQTVSRHTPKSSVSSGSHDSEKDDENQTVSRHTPTSSVSSGSRKYQSKDNTVPSPDDPFTRLQAGMEEDDSEEDDEKQTFNRHTPKSSVSSGSRKYQSKDNTVPAPDDPFTRLQAGMKADDSEEDDEYQTVSRHTPKSSVSSGSRKYQSKNKTVPSPDDPFTRLQAGMKDDSEKDDENQTVSRHTPTSSVSSESRKYQSKDNTVPSPDDPFTRLQAGMKGYAQDKEKDELADDSEEDDEKQTFNRHTPKSSVSSGSRKYQSNDKTVTSPDDPFTRLQAGMKRNAQDKGSDKHGQKQSVYENEESFSDGSRGSLSDNADASTQDDHFKRLVESTKDTKAKQTRSARNIKDETESSSSDDSDDNVQPAEEYNPFMKMVADVNRPKSKPGNSKHPSRKPSDDSTPNGAGEFSAPRPPPSTQRIYEEMTRMFNTGQGNFATSNPAFKTDRMFEDFAGMANGAEGNLATSNPAFQTDRMFEDFAGMANGAEGGAPNPPFTTESMFGNFFWYA
ncbi:hypothetical protein DPMN_113951 [Dreissena polymorpha]|uniref:Uncharacterized protein n=1 Tax=Dreissena polymorpha TaxID=45954 RepID=A0A9D4KJ03_DREPO|nr:hypothetical protein DPMN_113951 [Dreissena polymorpha]